MCSRSDMSNLSTQISCTIIPALLWASKICLSTFGEVVFRHHTPQELTSEKLEITCFFPLHICFFSLHQVLRATDSALIAPLATAVGQSLTLRWGQINNMSVCLFSAPANSILHTTYLLSHQSYCTVTVALVSIHQTEPTLTLAVQHVSRCPLNLWHAEHKYMWSWDADRRNWLLQFFSS